MISGLLTFANKLRNQLANWLQMLVRKAVLWAKLADSHLNFDCHGF